VLCSREGNRRSDVALSVRHRLLYLPTGSVDENPAYIHHLPFKVIVLEAAVTHGLRNVVSVPYDSKVPTKHRLKSHQYGLCE